jgi:malate synthase
MTNLSARNGSKQQESFLRYRVNVLNLSSVICHLYSPPRHLSFAILPARCFFDTETKQFAAMSLSSQTFEGIEIRGPVPEPFPEILTPDALRFVARLQREFNSRRKELLEQRERRQAEINQGKKPDFLAETANIRESNWQVAPIPEDLQDRRVEITGPTDRKMVINALNSGAKVFMADFEDANAPTWNNMIEGHINLRDAIRRTIEFSSPEGKEYRLRDQVAVLMVRPRGWHLVEKHLFVDGEAVSGGLFDFGLYVFHNAKELLARGSGPYFYLPKMESHLEARLWNDVFNLAQDELGIPRGSIRATVLIETILAAFEMDEILYELRNHSAGLNCGRWDYIFSCIKRFRNNSNFILADRALVTMTTHFMRSYSLLCIKTCHRRGAHAMGGMAAQIPIKNDEKANTEAFAKVKADKEREANDGHDGTWVAHPGLVPVALEAFDAVMKTPNQIDRKREDVSVTADDLLNFGPEEPITEQGLRTNISVGVQYLEAWLRGSGAVPIFNLMEDAATAEISRAQVWQWIRSSKGKLSDGRKVTAELFTTFLGEELKKIEKWLGSDRYGKGRFPDAADLFSRITTSDDFVPFLTLPGYERLG